MIDDIGRTAVDDLRRTVTVDLSPDDMLRQLHETRRRRSIAGVTSFGLVLLLVVAVALTGSGLGRDTVSTPPAEKGTPTSRPGPDSRLSRGTCRMDLVTCLGDREVRVDLRGPVQVDVPESFGDLQVWDSSTFEAFRGDVEHVGVLVAERARPVKYDDTWETDPAAGTSARSVARWLANRPFFADTVATRITLDGLPAWRVAPTVRRDAAMPVSKGDLPAAPTFAGTAVTISSGPHIPAEYVLVDVPGVGLTVIWSWSYSQGPAVLAGNREYLEALHFVTD